MSTLVTGATGFLGSHVARLLLARGTPVRALVRGTSNLRALAGLPVERVTGDLRDPASLGAALRGVRTLYHVAADYRLWARQPQEIYESNVAGTRNLLDAARHAGVEKFVYTSTVATIAVERPGALPDETTQARLEAMVGHYKRSKFQAEQEALQAARDGVPVVIVNPTAPVGPGDWKPTPTGKIILDFLKGAMPAYLDTGLNVVPVEDCAAGHLLAAERGKTGERYILGGENLTLKQILDKLAAVSGRSSPAIRLPHAVALAVGYADAAFSWLLGREPHIPLEGVRMARHKMWVDCGKAARELGFRASSTDAALERAARWYVEQGYVAAGAVHFAAPAAA